MRTHESRAIKVDSWSERPLIHLPSLILCLKEECEELLEKYLNPFSVG
jgi:hypothetical protein